MKNFIIIFFVLAAVFGEIRPGPIENRSCSSIQLENATVNAYTIAGNYFGCVDSPNKPPELKRCIRLNLAPRSSNTLDSTFFSASNTIGRSELLSANATIEGPKIKVVYDPLYSTLPQITFTALESNSDYLITLGCKDNIEDGWISYFARTPELCSMYRNKLDEAIEKYGLASIPLATVNHDNCGTYEVSVESLNF
ncbi:hypothetical protein G9C98_003067 [Cotesia typhae]|uniref:Uncharacterized protein n=1 Tax=Cotesia typhae TaxID=2053667 RepID=A0A8J5UXK3_9HYME|nr:hypothetical protein G9C98_003067 [Cotesia typhae]